MHAYTARDTFAAAAARLAPRAFSNNQKTRTTVRTSAGPAAVASARGGIFRAFVVLAVALVFFARGSERSHLQWAALFAARIGWPLILLSLLPAAKGVAVRFWGHSGIKGSTEDRSRSVVMRVIRVAVLAAVLVPAVLFVLQYALDIMLLNVCGVERVSGITSVASTSAAVLPGTDLAAPYEDTHALSLGDMPSTGSASSAAIEDEDEGIELDYGRSQPAFSARWCTMPPLSWLVVLRHFLDSEMMVLVRGRPAALLGSKGALLLVWLAEVVLRRNNPSTSSATQIVLALSVLLHMLKLAVKDALSFAGPNAAGTARVSIVPATAWRWAAQTWSLLGWEELFRPHDNAVPQQLPDAVGVRDFPLWDEHVVDVPVLAVTVLLVAVVISLSERALSLYLARNRPARVRLTVISLESTVLWWAATLAHVTFWWLLQPTSVASLFICAQQWWRFKQVRTIGPTVVFAAIEIGTIVLAQVAARRIEQSINDRPVARGTDARDPAAVQVVGRQLLQVGDFVRIEPGSEAPGTIVAVGAIGPLSRGDSPKSGFVISEGEGPPLKFVINTTSIDGETNGKERTFTDWPPRAILGEAGTSQLASNEREPATSHVASLTAATLGLNAEGYVGGPAADAHLSRHPCVIRHGARIAELTPWPIWGLVVGFNGSSVNDEDVLELGALESYLKLVSRLHVGMLIGYTAIAVAAAVIFGKQKLSDDLVIELLLTNNVVLTMTLSAVLGVVVWLLHREFDPVESMDARAKHAFVAFTEQIARARLDGSARGVSDVSTIVGVHLSDKTGTITRNEMLLQGSIALGYTIPGAELAAQPLTKRQGVDAPVFQLIGNDDPVNEIVVALHMATTSNSRLAPNLEPEEQAYTHGLGAKLLDIVTLPSGWQTVKYRWHGTVFKVERLFLGLSRKHRCVAAIVLEPIVRPQKAIDSDASNASSNSRNSREAWQMPVRALSQTDSINSKQRMARIVLQGAPEGAAGETGLSVRPAILPNLKQSLDLVLDSLRRDGSLATFPGGAQRNWVFSVSQAIELIAGSTIPFSRGKPTPFDASRVSAPWLATVAAALRGDPNSRDIDDRDSFLEALTFDPVRLMVLIDLYRVGVKDVPSFLCKRRMSFWMVTGDGHANAAAIATALGMHKTHVRIAFDRTAANPHRNLAESIVSNLERLRHNRHVTLFLGKEEQRVLCDLPLVPASELPDELVKRLKQLFISADSVTGHPRIQAVCYESEVDIKGALVRFVHEFLGLGTVFTGDGKNDIHALRQADVGIAFPSVDTNDSSDNDDEGSIANNSTGRVSGVVEHDPEVAASAPVRVTGKFWSEFTTGSITSWAATLWVQVSATVLLLVVKQSGTAGLNCAAAADARFADNRDPYDPSIYFAFNTFGFAAVIAAASLIVRRSAENDANQGFARLKPLYVIACSVASYTVGFIAFFAGPWMVIAIRLLVLGQLRSVIDISLVQHVVSNQSMAFRTTCALGFLLVAIITVAVYLARMSQRVTTTAISM